MLKRNALKGFTLIELVMVIVILAILAVVAIPQFFDLSGRAENSAEQGVIGGVRAGIATYHAGQNPPAYPTSLDGGAPSATCATTACFTTVLAQGGVNTADWTRTATPGEYEYTPKGTTFTYNSTDGSFD